MPCRCLVSAKGRSLLPSFILSSEAGNHGLRFFWGSRGAVRAGEPAKGAEFYTSKSQKMSLHPMQAPYVPFSTQFQPSFFDLSNFYAAPPPPPVFGEVSVHEILKEPQLLGAGRL